MSYEAEADRIHQKYRDIIRRQEQARLDARRNNLPEVWTIRGKKRAKTAQLIQGICEHLGVDMDDLSSAGRIAVEQELRDLCRRYNVHPGAIPFAGLVMDAAAIEQWGNEKDPEPEPEPERDETQPETPPPA
jgi:hypothetical protein